MALMGGIMYRDSSVAGLARRVGAVAVAALIAAGCEGGPFVERYGGAGSDFGQAVVQTQDLGFAMVGSTASYGSGGHDAYLVRTDGAGHELWSRTFGTAGEEFGMDVRTLDDGDLVILRSDESGAAVLIRTDSTGGVEWERPIPSNAAGGMYRVAPTLDGGFVGVGYVHNGVGYQGWAAKVDGSGHIQWNRFFGEPTGFRGLGDVRATADGGFVACGFVKVSGGSQDYYLLKLDADGQEQWSKTYGLSKYDAATAIEVMSDGGYAIAGEQTDPVGLPNVGFAWLVRTDPLGNVLWDHRYGLANADQGARDMTITKDGGFVMVDLGVPAPPASGWDVFLARASADGTELWSRRLGLSGISTWSFSVQETVTGAFVIAANQTDDAALIKTDPDGLLPPPL